MSQRKKALSRNRKSLFLLAIYDLSHSWETCRLHDMKGPIKWIPGGVLKRLGNVDYLVRLSTNEIKKVHVSQLKLSLLDDVELRTSSQFNLLSSLIPNSDQTTHDDTTPSN
ncbi:hypothetical protein FQA39_LY13460 [Lamprigera yunnana]|nr:hypothetical protein FQA39_LY13460 [Lamprigera yunnana]